MISNLIYSEIIAAVKEIKETNRCTHPAILAFEQQVQTVAPHASHLYTRCFQFRLRLKALMITNGMPIPWITINPADLWCPLITYWTRIELDLGSNVVSVFVRKTATMNPVAMAKFFNFTYKTVLLSLFVSEYHDGGLWGPVPTYLGTIKINDRDIFYLPCLVWLKKASHLPTLRIKIRENEEFCIRLLAFLEYIIKCFAKNDAPFDILHHTYFNVYRANITKDFTAQLKEDSKVVAKKV